MKFRNKATGAILEPAVELVEQQLAKNPMYEVVDGKAPPAGGNNAGGGDKPLEKMKKADLLKMAQDMGLDVAESMTVPKLVEAIKAGVPAAAPAAVPAGGDDAELDALELPDLLTLAAEKGADVSENMTKAEIVEAINAAAQEE